MIKVLFICHGNICRSPMAEFVMKDMVKKLGKENDFFIASSATSTEEIGNPVHPGTRKKLAEYNISTEGKFAVQFKIADYDKYDYIVCMDTFNVRNLMRITRSDIDNKIYKLLDFDCGGDVDDPWYTGDFDTTYNDIYRGCKGLLKSISENC